MAPPASCPLCGALPIDWVDDPHKTHDALFLALADLRAKAGVGEKPMLAELPSIIGDRLHQARMILAALRDPSLSIKGKTVFGKDLAEWQHRATLWLLNEDAK